MAKYCSNLPSFAESPPPRRGVDECARRCGEVTWVNPWGSTINAKVQIVANEELER